MIKQQPQKHTQQHQIPQNNHHEIQHTSHDAPLVYVYNLLQDIIDTFHTLPTQQKLKMQRQYCTFYNQYQLMSVISQFPNKSSYYIIVLSQLSEKFVQYACSLLGIQKNRVHVLVPNQGKLNGCGSICQYLLSDKIILSRLEQIGKFDLLSIAITQRFLDLCDRFKGIANPIQYVTRQNWHKIKRYGTKSGIRQLMQQLGNPIVPLPKGKIFLKSKNSFDQTLKYLAQILKIQSVVVKTQKGISGYGVVIIKKSEIQKFMSTQQKIQFIKKQKLKQSFWQHFDIVVQDLIQLDFSVGPPCLQMCIQKNGQVRVVHACAMCFIDQCHLDSFEFGYQSIKSEVREQIIKYGQMLGKLYHQMGYQGYINIDYHVDIYGKVWLAQSNIRRSGALFVYNIAQRLVGKQKVATKFLKNKYFFQQKIRKLDFNAVIQGLKKKGIHFNKQTGNGIVLVSQSSIKAQKYLQFIHIASNAKQTEKMYEIFKQLKQQLA